MMIGLGSTAASAETPAPANPIITYAGSSVITSLDDGSDYPVEIAATVDCTTIPCGLSGTVSANGVVLAFTGPQPLPVIDGVASAVAPQSGDPCDQTYQGGGPITVTVTADAIQGSAEAPGTDVIDCPDGSSVQYSASRLEIAAQYVSGDVCFLTGDCSTEPRPVGAPIVDPPHSGALAPAEPGTLSTLPTVTEALTARTTIWAVVGTIVLVLLVALPSQLLNSAVEHGGDRVSAWWRRRRGDRPRVEHPWLLPVGLVTAAVISSFADPGFGFSGGGLRVFLSILVSFAIDAVLGWMLVLWLLRRTKPGTPARVRFVPATLAIVAIAVIFTRLTGFQPGIIFGLVAGIVVGATLATADRARIALAGLGWSFVVAVVGWVGYSLISPTDLTPVALFARETLSALAIGGIAALPITLVPVRGLIGHEVYSWNRWAWAGAYGLGLFGFFVVLMPMPFSWQTVPLSLWTWVAIFAGYAVVAVGLWLGVTRPWAREASES
jgi:hypothetical protein